MSSKYRTFSQFSQYIHLRNKCILYLLLIFTYYCMTGTFSHDHNYEILYTPYNNDDQKFLNLNPECSC